MVVIALSGKKYSGKTTCSDIIVKNFQFLGFKKLSFATPLKDILSTLFSFTDECYDTKKKETYIPSLNTTPRKLMQELGEFFRTNLTKTCTDLKLSNDNIWIHVISTIIKKNPNNNYIIDDLRHQDEYDFIKSIDGHIIKISRPSLNSNDNKQETQEIHISEQDCLLYDYSVINKNFDDLNSCLDKIVLNIISL